MPVTRRPHFPGISRMRFSHVPTNTTRAQGLVGEIGFAQIGRRLFRLLEMGSERLHPGFEDLSQMRIDGRKAAQVDAEGDLQLRDIDRREVGAQRRVEMRGERVARVVGCEHAKERAAYRARRAPSGPRH